MTDESKETHCVKVHGERYTFLEPVELNDATKEAFLQYAESIKKLFTTDISDTESKILASKASYYLPEIIKGVLPRMPNKVIKVIPESFKLAILNCYCELYFKV